MYFLNEAKRCFSPASLVQLPVKIKYPTYYCNICTIDHSTRKVFYPEVMTKIEF